MTADELQTLYAAALLGACALVIAFYAWSNKP